MEPNVPTWTDMVSAISAAIGVPLILYTLYKLIKKDEERESEIKSLATIASQLAKIQSETEKRYKASKKPYITIKLEKAQESNRIRLDFTNTNSNVTIKNFKLSNDNLDFAGKNVTASSITDSGGQQMFSIVLNPKEERINWIMLHLDYTTEEGFVFIQDVSVWLDKGQYLISPSVLIDKENSAF